MPTTEPTTEIQPYLMFGGRCEEALAFYQRALGATIDMKLLFRDSPEAPPPGTLPPGFENKVMHSSFRVGSAVVMASDGCEAASQFSGFSLSLSLPTAAEVDRAFNALAEGGKVCMPLAQTFWSPRFGMVTDRFGVNWMLTVLHKSGQ
jgi:PhnB protein